MWKQKVRDKFRTEIQDWLQKDFEFYAMRALPGVDAKHFFKTHFQDILGKTYTPYEDEDIYSLALDKTDPDGNNEALKAELRKFFIVEACQLGQSPEIAIGKAVEKGLQQQKIPQQWLTHHYLERYKGRNMLIGYCKTSDSLQICGDDNQYLLYHVRLIHENESPKPGAHLESYYSGRNVPFVILYSHETVKNGEYHVFHVKDSIAKVPGNVINKTDFPIDLKDGYFYYLLDEEVTIGEINISELISDLRKKNRIDNSLFSDYEPMFITAEDLMRYRFVW